MQIYSFFAILIIKNKIFCLIVVVINLEGNCMGVGAQHLEGRGFKR